MDPHQPNDERRSPGPEAGLSFGERFYLREAVKGMGVLARHFWKNLFGFRKVRYRGLAKNTSQLHVLFALANLVLAKRKLLAGAYGQ